MQGLAVAYLQGECKYISAATHFAASFNTVDGTCDGTVEGEAEEDACPTFSIVQEGYFVLRKAFERWRRTNTPLSIVPLLDSLVAALRETCLRVLTRELRRAGAAEPSNGRALVALNSLQCAEQYTQDLRGYVASAFAERHAALNDVAEPALAELDAIGSQLVELASHATRELAASLMPTAWLRLEFDSVSYVIESDEIELDLARSFESNLLRPLDDALTPLAKRLRPVNVDAVVHALAAALAIELEGCVVHKSFNESGGILLCGHLSQLIDRLSTWVVGSVRTEFARLNQIAFLLNSSSVQEAAALLLSSLATAPPPPAADGADSGSGGTTSDRLTRREAARVLLRRTDLARAEVRELFEHDLDDDDWKD